MQLLLLAAAALTLVPVLLVSQRRGPVAYLSLAFFASFLTIHIVAPVVAPQETFNDRVLHSKTEAAALVLMAGIAFAVSYTMPYREFFQPARSGRADVGARVDVGVGLGARVDIGVNDGHDQEQLNLSYRTLIVAVSVALAGLIIFAIGRSGSITGFVTSARFAGRGTGSVALEMIGRFLARMAPIAVVLGMLTPSPSKRRFSLLAAVALAGFYFLFLKGTRAEPIAILGAAMVGYAAGGRSWRRTSRRTKLVMLVGVLLLAGLSSALKDARHLDRNETRIEGLARGLTNVSQSPAELLGRDPLNYHSVLIGVVDNVDRIDAPLLGPVRRVVFAPLPTGALGLKPPDTNVLVGDALNSKNKNTTVPPTVPGEGLLALGNSRMSPFLWAVLYVALLRLIERLAARSMVIRVAVLATTVELGLLATRGQLFQTTVRFVFTVLLVWVTLHLGGRHTRRRRARNAAAPVRGTRSMIQPISPTRPNQDAVAPDRSGDGGRPGPRAVVATGR